jgi:hypothetical protein
MPLSNKPQQVSDTVWYYEEGRSVAMVVEHWDESGRLIGQPIQFRIPWPMLEKSVMRKQQARAIAKAKRDVRKRR